MLSVPRMLRPLHIAADRNSADVVRLLLDAGADPELINHNGKTPAHYAVKNWKLHGTPELAELKKAVAHLPGAGLKPISSSEFCDDGYIVQAGDVRLSIVAENALGDPGPLGGRSADSTTSRPIIPTAKASASNCLRGN